LTEVDFHASLRWARRFRGKTLARRPVEQLPRLLDQPEGVVYLLDTCVYIDSFHDQFAPEIERAVDEVSHYHSVCALQEMALAVGRLDQEDARTKRAVADVATLVGSIVPQRLFHHDADTALRAGLLAGTLARIQDYGKEHRFRAVNDCTLFLQSQKLGTTLLTRNYADFDILLQMMPDGRVAFY
jgi:predicted nucleic acid-binding protein